MSKQSNALQKARIPKQIRMLGRRIGENASELGRDVQNIQELMRNKRRRFEMGGLPKNAFDYENELLQTVDDSIKRRLKFRYGNAIKPWIGLGGVAYMQSQSNPTTKKRLKKGLVNPVLHEIRQANPAPTRKSVKYSTSTYPDSVQGMAGQGYNRNSNKLRQLMEDASTLATGGRPNPEHNAKRFYGLYGQSAVNEPQKSMTQVQTMQREINQSLRSGHSNRRVAKSSLKKGSYNNVFVSGSAVDPNVIVQPKKGRRFKGQTTGMMLVSKRAKTIRKDSSKENDDNNSNTWKFPNDIVSNALNLATNSLAAEWFRRQLKRDLSSKNKNDAKPTSSTASYGPSAPYATTKIPTSTSTTSTMPINTTTNKPFKEKFTDFAKNPMKTFADIERNAYNAGVRGYQQAKQTYGDVSQNVSNFVQDARANSKPIMQTFADIERNAYNKITQIPQNVKNKISQAGQEIAQSPGVGRKMWRIATKGIQRASLPQTVSDLAILGYGMLGRGRSPFYDEIQNKVNVNAVPDSTYQRPVKVGEERYDVRPRDPNRDIRSDNEYFASDLLQSQYGPSTYELGDSKEYEPVSMEQLPRRLREEQGRFTRPVARRVHRNSASALTEDVMNALNVKDVTSVGSMLTPYVTNYANADFGTPFFGGHTTFRTPLSAAIGSYPVETITGWAKESSRDGQKSYSAPGALKFYRNNLKNQSNSINQRLQEINNNLLSNPEDVEALAYKNYYTNLQEKTKSASEALRQIDSRVSTWEDLQNEINIARKNNNQIVVDLLTKPTVFESPSSDEMQMMPSIEALAGYQMPLRNVTIARVGDKYGENLMPYQLRGRNAGPQSVSYVSNANFDDYQGGLGDVALGFFGVDTAGVRQVPNYDDDWVIGAGLSNYGANTQPIYVNDIEQILDKNGNPVLDANGYPVTTQSSVLVGPRLSDAINPATGEYVPYRSFFPSARGKWEDSVNQWTAPYKIDESEQNLWNKYENELEGENVEKRKKTSLPKSNKSVKKMSVKKSSLTPSSLMPPMGSASPVKMPKPSKTVMPTTVTQPSTTMTQPSTNVGSSFMKSLNPNPKPIEPVHAKHKNKYFK